MSDAVESSWLRCVCETAVFLLARYQLGHPPFDAMAPYTVFWPGNVAAPSPSDSMQSRLAKCEKVGTVIHVTILKYIG